MNREKEKEGRGACCIEWMMLVLITHLWRFFYCVLYNTMAFPSPVPFTPAGALSSCQTLPRSRTGLSTSPSSCLWICPRPQRPGEHGDHGGVVGVGVVAGVGLEK